MGSRKLMTQLSKLLTVSAGLHSASNAPRKCMHPQTVKWLSSGKSRTPVKVKILIGYWQTLRIAPTPNARVRLKKTKVVTICSASYATKNSVGFVLATGRSTIQTLEAITNAINSKMTNKKTQRWRMQSSSCKDTCSTSKDTTTMRSRRNTPTN